MLFTLATLIFIHFCALITPGPDFFLVSQTAISRSKQDAVLVVAGISTGAMFWAVLALLGLNIIFEKMVWLKEALLIAGGVYLFWLGTQMLRSAFSNKKHETQRMDLPRNSILFFLKGLLTNLSNPKAIIYFGSVFSLFLNNPVLEHHHLFMFVVIMLETILWFLFVVFIFSLSSFQVRYRQFSKWIDGVSGGVFTLFGAFLIGNR